MSKSSEPAANNSSSSSSSIANLLERRYYYQNQQTGNISATSLTTRQLCRVLCPASTAASTQTTAATAALTPDTQLLAVNDDGRSYSNDGWKVAKAVPIIREAVSQWYYEEIQQQQQQQAEAKEDTKTEATATSTTSVKGPVSCRALSVALRSSSCPENEYNNEQQQQQLQTTRVYCSDNTVSTTDGGTWKTISELPNLQAAIQAFDVVAVALPPPAVTALLSPSDDQQQQQQQQQYDPSEMMYDDDDEKKKKAKTDSNDDNTNVQDELELFLASTDQLGAAKGKNKRSRGGDGNEDDEDDEDEDEAYESDGGTRYMKHQGKWVHEDLVPKKKKKKKPSTTTANNSNKKTTSATTTPGNNPNKRKNKKAKFAARNARCWIYVTGLPHDTTEDELSTYFAKAGLLDLNPETQKPKIKLYKDKTKKSNGQNNCKGDASICYARPESVELAVTLFDEAPFRHTVILPSGGGSGSSGNGNNNYVLKVERAKFEQKRSDDVDELLQNKPKVSYAKRKVAKMATKQAVDWDDGEFNGRITGGHKGLRIIVIKHVFHPKDLVSSSSSSSSGNNNNTEDELLASLQQRLTDLCEPFGTIEKMTVFSQHYEGVVIVKFAQPGAASDAVHDLNGYEWIVGPTNKTNGNTATTLEASFWDGVTDYTVRDHDKEHEEENKRLDEFGHWLDQQQQQELPDELKLQTQE